MHHQTLKIVMFSIADTRQVSIPSLAKICRALHYRQQQEENPLVRFSKGANGVQRGIYLQRVAIQA